MSSEHNGIARSNNSTSYIMLNSYCGKANVPLGVKNVAANFAPYGANPMMQNLPVFSGTNYAEAPYQNPLLFCGSCGGNYCKASEGYKCADDSVSYVSASPTTMINQTCAIQGACAGGFNPKQAVAQPKPQPRR